MIQLILYAIFLFLSIFARQLALFLALLVFMFLLSLLRRRGEVWIEGN
jgi:hypothetical protein